MRSSCPATALINLIYIRSNTHVATVQVVTRCFVIALIAPMVLALLLMVG